MDNENRRVENDIDRIINANSELEIAKDLQDNNYEESFVKSANKGSVSINYLAIAIVLVVVGGIYLGYLLAK